MVTWNEVDLLYSVIPAQMEIQFLKNLDSRLLK